MAGSSHGALIASCVDSGRPSASVNEETMVTQGTGLSLNAKTRSSSFQGDFTLLRRKGFLPPGTLCGRVVVTRSVINIDFWRIHYCCNPYMMQGEVRRVVAQSERVSFISEPQVRAQSPTNL